MNDNMNPDDSILREYINPESRAKAPEDFTLNTMSRIVTDVTIAKPEVVKKRVSRMPVYSSVVTLSLIAAALLTSEAKTNSLTPDLLRLIKNLQFSIPHIDISSIFNADLPGILIYLSVAVFILTLLDSGLSFYFHREK
jgi:hypothetical protein